MRVHWHAAGPGAPFLRPLLDAWLAALHREARPERPALLSWGGPGGLEYRLYPGGAGRAPSWDALASLTRPDLRAVLRLEGERGGTIALAWDGVLPREPDAGWAWTALEPAPGAADPDLPRAVLYPVISAPAAAAGDPRVLGLVPDWRAAAAWEAWLALARELRRALPVRRVRLLFDPSWLRGAGDTHEVPRVEAGNCGTLLFLGRDLRWGPAVLAALGAGQHVLAPADAVYAGLLDDGWGDLLRHPGALASPCPTSVRDGLALEELRERLEEARADPARAEARTRRARAWARRWTPERMGADLQGLVERAAGRRGPGGCLSTPQQPVRWCLRREIGIGDVVFTLSVAWALKHRDPACRVRLHTLPAHAEWVSWFPFLDHVTSGPFQPEPGERVGDFEQDFPQHAARDRTLALGAQIGVRPEGWVPPPRVPEALLAAAKARLGPCPGLRIAFAPCSRTRALTRSLPPDAAEETARLLGEVGQVVWLDEAPRARGPLPGVLDLAGQLTVAELVAVLACCDLCVAVDTGVLHLAVTLRRPVVGLFTHIGALQRLWLAERFLALQPHLPCAPCGEGPEAFHCRRLPAAAPAPPPCVGLLQPRRVLEAARAALSGDGRQVWSLPPEGPPAVWDVDRLPPPWPVCPPGRLGGQ